MRGCRLHMPYLPHNRFRSNRGYSKHREKPWFSTNADWYSCFRLGIEWWWWTHDPDCDDCSVRVRPVSLCPFLPLRLFALRVVIQLHDSKSGERIYTIMQAARGLSGSAISWRFPRYGEAYPLLPLAASNELANSTMQENETEGQKASLHESSTGLTTSARSCERLLNSPVPLDLSSPKDSLYSFEKMKAKTTYWKYVA